MSPRRLYISECILLVAIATPLAIAEQNFAYLGMIFVAVLVGWNRTVVRDRPLLGPSGSRVAVIAAFVYLIYEYFRVTAISVIALSHFMQLVCATKLVQRRTYRDDAQFFVLSLLLLVVAAIVSGNLLLPLALAVFLSVGIDTLMRFHLTLEQARVAHHNHRVEWSHVSAPSVSERPVRTLQMTSSVTLISTVIGVLIFVLCPRLGANSIFPRIDAPQLSQTVSGFTNTLNFTTIGPILASEKAVMRVQIESDGKPTGELDHGPYFRGAVLTQYHCEVPTSQSGWEWKRPGAASGRTPIPRSADDDGQIELIPDAHGQGPLLVQRYFLEPGENLSIFTCFPALRIRSDSQPLEDVRKWVDDQTIQLQKPLSRPLRYTVESAATVTPALAQVMEQERAISNELEPAVVTPDAVPRVEEILELSARFKQGLKSLEDPASREMFAQRVCRFLQSSEYTYTASPPTVPRNAEPIGEFLLSTKTGHCEYFASGMALICQLNNVPARIVVGFCGGDYNPVGNFYVVRQKNAHSWVEVFIPGRDWVTFDPTPPSEVKSDTANRILRAITRYIDYAQFEWANVVISYDADQRRSLFEKFSAWLLRPAQNEDTIMGAVIAFVRELFGWRLKLNWEERLIYWVFAILVVMLVMLISYVIGVALRWVWRMVQRFRIHHVHRANRPELEFYTRFCHYMRLWGIERVPGQTPAEFAEDLAARYPVCEGADDLAEAYYEVAFGGISLAPARLQRLNEFLERLAPHNRSTQPAGLSSP